MLEALRCPTCGASLPAASAGAPISCEYCGTSATLAPRVVERVIVERVVEPREGPPEGEDEAAPGPRCPRCARRLRPHATEHATLQVCHECGGVWLDQATVQRLRRFRYPDIEQAVKSLPALHPPSLESRLARLNCPECGRELRRVRLGDTRHGLDVCDEHGVWFDRAELGMFVQFWSEERAGHVAYDDLEAAGVPVSPVADFLKALSKWLNPGGY